MTAQRIYGLSPLPDQKFAYSEHHGRALGLFALHRNEAHRRPQCRLADRLGIGRIILLPLHEGLDVSGWDQPNVMAKLADLTTPEMSAAAGFHRNDAGRELAEKLQHLCAPQLLAQDRTTTAVGPMHLKHILRPVIISDMTALLCGSLQTHLGTLMPSGGGYIIRAELRKNHLHVLISDPRSENLDKAYTIAAERRIPRPPTTEYITSAHRSDDPRKRLIAAKIMPSTMPRITCPRTTSSLPILPIKCPIGALFTPDLYSFLSLEQGKLIAHEACRELRRLDQCYRKPHGSRSRQNTRCRDYRYFGRERSPKS